jgi:hypothetical protein
MLATTIWYYSGLLTGGTTVDNYRSACAMFAGTWVNP